MVKSKFQQLIDYSKPWDYVNEFLSKKNISSIKRVSKAFGLKYDIKVYAEVVSAETKYTFNYLSGAFGNNDLYTGAKNIKKFLNSSRFKERIKHLSARAVSNIDIIKKVNLSLKYLQKSDPLALEMNALCKRMVKKLEFGNGIILIGVSSKEKVMPFDRLLAHEMFHLVLAKNDIVFGDINQNFEYFDEGLAIFLSYVWTGNAKKVLELNDTPNNAAAVFWYKKLLNPNESRLAKIKKVYKNLKEGGKSPKTLDRI